MSTATIAEAQKLAREWDPYGARAEQPAKRTRPNQQTR